MNTKLIFHFIVFGLLICSDVMFGMNAPSLQSLDTYRQGWKVVSINAKRPKLPDDQFLEVISAGLSIIPKEGSDTFVANFCLADSIKKKQDKNYVEKRRVTECNFLLPLKKRFVPINGCWYLTIENEAQRIVVFQIDDHTAPIITSEDDLPPLQKVRTDTPPLLPRDCKSDFQSEESSIIRPFFGVFMFVTALFVFLYQKGIITLES